MITVKRKNSMKISVLSATAWSLAIMLALPLASPVLSPVIGNVNLGTAQAKDDEKPKPPTRKTPAIRAKVFEELNKAQEAAEAKNYNEAIKVLDALRDKGGKRALNSYELATLYNLYAFVYFTKEDYDKALKSYQEVIAQPDIPFAMEVNTKFTIAQLYFVQEKWGPGIRQLEDWFKAKRSLGEDPGANAHALAAQGYYQTKQFRKSRENIEIAINDYKQRGKVPKEQWWGLQRFLYFEQGNTRKVIEILEETLVYYQKKQYWVQLAAMYNESKQDSKALAAMDAAYEQGLLEKDRELVNLSYMKLAGETPYQAAQVLYSGIKNKQVKPTAKTLEVLGNALRQAQETERAIPVMRKAAQASDKGEIWSRLASVYLDSEQFDKAEEAAELALKKGGLKRQGNTELVLGMARFNLSKFEEARAAFVKAAKDEKTKQFADSWIKYMEKEVERQKSLGISS